MEVSSQASSALFLRSLLPPTQRLLIRLTPMEMMMNQSHNTLLAQERSNVQRLLVNVVELHWR